MDKFFIQTTCDRCHQEFKGGARIMSKFNTDCICMDCASAEKRHPDYKEACRVKAEAVKNGDHNFPGIGMRPVTVEVTCEVVHRQAFQVTLSPAQWTDLIMRSKVPDIDDLYTETDRGQPEELDFAVADEDGNELISWG